MGPQRCCRMPPRSSRARIAKRWYVPMTRGRHTNQAFIGLRGEDTAVELLARCLATDWIDQPAHARRLHVTAAA